ncbi:MAG: ABC transporter substrate-binding protein [Xanthobacteraceae bacterium]|nr:ABC transporter substrate-binding protein [Xanthobacteraceae bacterium]
MTDHKRQAWSAFSFAAGTALVGIALICGLIPLASSLAQPAATTINVVVQPAATGLPMVVAEKKGMLAKRNIAAKWTVSQVPISDTVNTLGRQYDIAMGTQPALIAAAGSGIPVVVITGGGLDTPQIPLANVVARKDSGITSFKQLGGKTVGALTLTGNIHFALLSVLLKAGVDLDSIHWVVATIPQLPDLLKAGRVEAIEEIEPFAGMAIGAGGVALGDPFRGIGDRAFIGYWLAQRDWANRNQDLVLRVNDAMNEASDWIRANGDEARAILGSFTGLQGPALEKTPIPAFSFAPTVADLKKEIVPDLQEWNEILKRTSDIRPVEVSNLLPAWVK